MEENKRKEGEASSKEAPLKKAEKTAQSAGSFREPQKDFSGRENISGNAVQAAETAQTQVLEEDEKNTLDGEGAFAGSNRAEEVSVPEEGAFKKTADETGEIQVLTLLQEEKLKEGSEGIPEKEEVLAQEASEKEPEARSKGRRRKKSSKNKKTVKRKPMTPAQKVATTAIMVALAMIFSYVEALIPINFGIPGIKLGLANLVVVVSMYLLNVPLAALISLVRILLSALLFGNLASLLYSLAGGFLSFVVMALLKKVKGFSVIGVSIAGGICHNIGQILTAWFMLGSFKIVYYLPVLIIAGALTGLIIGILAKKCLTLLHV